MKKILLLILFLVAFFIISFKSALANDAPYCSNTTHLCQCSPDGQIWHPGGPQVYKCCLNTLIGEAIGVNVCTGSVNTLVPLTTAAPKDPTCPRGYNQPIICSNSGVCCKADGLGCEGQSGIPLSCDDARKMWTSETLKNYCGNYGLQYKFDSGKCVLFAPTLWNRNNITCQGVEGFDTAIGCVPTGDLKLFLTFILKWAFFASGGIILLLIISTGYTIITSSGNPEKLQGAQENIVALFSGLALIAFSLVLLQAIGADILNLKTFIP